MILMVEKKKEKEKEYEKKIKDLEERIKWLEREKEGSTVEGILGGIIPGMDRIVKALEKASPEFKKRIDETDREIKNRLKKGYSGKPKVSFSYSVRTLVPSREGEIEIKRVRKPLIIRPREEVKEPLIDIFDEEEYIHIIAEMPGVEEKDIKIELEKDTIKISGGRYSKELKLPCSPKNIDEKSYRNGILEIKLRKENAG
jgi:HSP20 family molecular chaperone IbpA